MSSLKYLPPNACKHDISSAYATRTRLNRITHSNLCSVISLPQDYQVQPYFLSKIFCFELIFRTNKHKHIILWTEVPPHQIGLISPKKFPPIIRDITPLAFHENAFLNRLRNSPQQKNPYEGFIRFVGKISSHCFQHHQKKKNLTFISLNRVHEGYGKY